MDTSLSVYVFEWQGEVHCHIDRVGRSSGRRYAPRSRLATYRKAAPSILDECALSWFAAHSLADLLAASLVVREGEALIGAPQRGATGGEPTACPPAGRDDPGLNSENPPPPYRPAAPSGVSDGLYPPGETLPLF